MLSVRPLPKILSVGLPITVAMFHPTENCCNANTTVHLTEYLFGVRYRIKKHAYLCQNGQLRRFDYEEIDHCCENFRLVDRWLDLQNLQRRGKVGHAEARLVMSRDIVKVVMEQLQSDETVFLHPLGVDEECDAARASLRR